MSESRPGAPRRPDPDDVAIIEELRQLAGEEMPEDQDAVLEPDEIEKRRTPTLTELDRGDPFPDLKAAVGPEATLDGLAAEELRDGETDDADVATEEGLVYVPPSDPVIHTDPLDPEGVEVAAGPAVSALSEPYDEDHAAELLPEEDELTARVREALRADAATTAYADHLIIETDGGTATIRGVVDDIYDSDAIAEVVERVEGIDEVIDETELADG
jgi:hypothetical protein